MMPLRNASTLTVSRRIEWVSFSSVVRWWRYPVKPFKARTLNHTKLRGKRRAIYPVRKI